MNINEAIHRGFIKAALSEGFSDKEAEQIWKLAVVSAFPTGANTLMPPSAGIGIPNLSGTSTGAKMPPPLSPTGMGKLTGSLPGMSSGMGNLAKAPMAMSSVLPKQKIL